MFTTHSAIINAFSVRSVFEEKKKKNYFQFCFYAKVFMSSRDYHNNFFFWSKVEYFSSYIRQSCKKQYFQNLSVLRQPQACRLKGVLCFFVRHKFAPVILCATRTHTAYIWLARMASVNGNFLIFCKKKEKDFLFITFMCVCLVISSNIMTIVLPSFPFQNNCQKKNKSLHFNLLHWLLPPLLISKTRTKMPK